ncbi:hypothetical protein Goklo_029754, partial [Gossypium klotzschianum]|nr:hypothetical protein [Gossypium klotzschianum]
GLEIGISDILPRVEHRNCARHVFANWSRRKLGKSYEKSLQRCELGHFLGLLLNQI